MYRSLGLVHVLRRSDTEPLTVPALFWTVCFTVIVVVAIIGNCSVLWIVLGKSILIPQVGEKMNISKFKNEGNAES